MQVWLAFGLVFNAAGEAGPAMSCLKDDLYFHMLI